MNPTLRHRLEFWIVLAGASWLGGCATQRPAASSAPTLLMTVQVAGGAAPTTQQAADVLQAMSPAIAHAGFQLADSVENADYLMTVTLTPDPLGANQGYLSVHKIEPVRQSSQNRAGSSASALAALQERQRELERWGESRSAPAYSP